MRAAGSSKSAWARDGQVRFGHGSIYRETHECETQTPTNLVPAQHTRAARAKPASTIRRDEIICDLVAHIESSEAHVRQLKAMLHQLQCDSRRALAPQPAHDAIAGGDPIVEVLAHMPACALGATAQVCTSWLVASEQVRDIQGPALSSLVLGPLMATMPTLRLLMRTAAVCTVWRAAACAERAAWRRAVELEFQCRSEFYLPDAPPPPPELSLVPYVEKVLRVSRWIGVEIVSSGGLLATVHKAYRVLGLLPMLSKMDKALLDELPDLTLVARPAPGAAPPPEEHDAHPFVIAGLERAGPRVRELGDILAVALLVVKSNEEEESSTANHGEDITALADDDDARALMQIVASTGD